MARVFYQPCSDKPARKNLQTTILNPVQVSEIADLLDPKLCAELNAAYPDGKLFIWGLASPRTRKAWQAMRPGDIVIFNTKTVVTVSAVFTHATHNRELALRLWGLHDPATNSTWENIYFVTDVRHHAIRFESIQAHIKSEYILSFWRYDETQSAMILEQFPELDRDYAASEVAIKEVCREIQEQPTDGTANRSTRLEHSYIVHHLFQNKPTSHCCICHKEYPRHLLVAAHIKKRSACSTNEKLDIENIAAPMCRLGCDPLFEYGYISVSNGIVVKHPSREMTEATTSYVESVLGNQVLGWGGKNRKYFDWHLDAHGFRPGELAGLNGR